MCWIVGSPSSFGGALWTRHVLVLLIGKLDDSVERGLRKVRLVHENMSLAEES